MKLENLLSLAQQGLLGLMIALAVWPFGSGPPYFEMWLSLAIVLSLVLWFARLVFTPALGQLLLSRVGWPVVTLLGLVAVVALPLANSSLTKDPVKRQWIEELGSQPREQLTLDVADEIAPPLRWPATASSLNPYGNQRLALRVALLICLVVVAGSFEDPRSVLVNLSVVGAVVGSMLAIFAIGQGPAGSFRKMYWFFEQASGYGPFINKNHYPFFANCLLGMTLGLFLHRQTQPIFTWKRIVHDPLMLAILASVALQATGVILSLSRGGVVTAMLAILCVWLLRVQTGDTKNWPALLAYAGVAGLVVALFYWVGFDLLESRLVTISDSEAYLTDGRWYLWQAAVNAWQQFPWFGSGGETYRYWETMFTEGGRQWNSITAQAIRADNELLDIASEYGILATGLVVLFVVTWLPRVLRAGRQDAMVAGASIGLLAVLMHSLADFGLRIPASGALAAILLGLALSSSHKERSVPAKPWQIAVGSSLAIIVLALAYQALGVVSQAAKADQYRAQAKTAIEANELDQAQQAISASVSQEPDSALLRLDLARLCFNAAARSELKEQRELWRSRGLQLAITARELCPLMFETPVWLYEHHRLLKSGLPEFEYLTRAHRLHPAQPMIAFALGERLWQQGQLDAAYTTWRESLVFSSDKLTKILEVALGDQQRSAAELQAVLDAILPDDPLVLYQASQQLRDEQVKRTLLERAQQHLDAWLAERSQREQVSGFVTAARIHAALDQVQPSVQAYRTALRYKPDDYQARYECALLLLNAERFNEARNEVRILSSLHGNRPPITRLMQDIEAAAQKR